MYTYMWCISMYQYVPVPGTVVDFVTTTVLLLFYSTGNVPAQRVSHQGSSQNQRFLRFHHIKRANNLFSILKLLVTVPKIDKKTSTINMKNLGQLCHF